MTEREKMLAGEIYDSRDSELLHLYQIAKKRLADFDNLPASDSEGKNRLLTELLGAIGENVWIEKTFSCDYGIHIRIGRNTFINYNCVFLDDNYISIGENGLIGPAVHIYTALHPPKASERIYTKADGLTGYRTFTKPVSIGSNCWIGGGSVICPGVTIGDDVVIGAGSVVTTRIPDHVVAYGVPCRVMRDNN